jgi:hypothetical protein
MARESLPMPTRSHALSCSGSTASAFFLPPFLPPPFLSFLGGIARLLR